MSGVRATTTTSSDPLPGALCHYCVPGRDGAPSTLHECCIGYQVPDGGLCGCDCPNATMRRRTAAKSREWVRMTRWEPGQGYKGPARTWGWGPTTSGSSAPPAHIENGDGEPTPNPERSG